MLFSRDLLAFFLVVDLPTRTKKDVDCPSSLTPLLSSLSVTFSAEIVVSPRLQNSLPMRPQPPSCFFVEDRLLYTLFYV